MRAQAAMMSATGREATTEQTAARLLEVGLGELCDPVLYYAAPATRPDPAVPGWRVERCRWDDYAPVDHFAGKGANPWQDFAAILLSWSAQRPALFFEDDVWACRNAPRAMLELEAPRDAGVVSFFDLRNEWPRPGLHRAPPRRPFWGAQALLFPAHAIAGLQLEALRGTSHTTWDTWIGEACHALGLRVYHYSPSLFQHRGATSIGQPGNIRPTADNFPGEDFDALGPCVYPIVPGPFLAPLASPCAMHGGEIHPFGRSCPALRD